MLRSGGCWPGGGTPDAGRRRCAARRGAGTQIIALSFAFKLCVKALHRVKLCVFKLCVREHRYSKSPRCHDTHRTLRSHDTARSAQVAARYRELIFRYAHMCVHMQMCARSMIAHTRAADPLVVVVSARRHNALGWVGVILFIKCDMMLLGPKVFRAFEKERSSRWQQCKEACPRCRRFRCPSRRR